MDLKAVLLVCLVLFATTLVISVANMPMVSPTFSQNTGNDIALVDAGFIEPMGDPVDNPAAPN